MKTSTLKMNPANPRRIQPDKLEKLCASITAIPLLYLGEGVFHQHDTVKQYLRSLYH